MWPQNCELQLCDHGCEHQNVPAAQTLTPESSRSESSSEFATARGLPACCIACCPGRPRGNRSRCAQLEPQGLACKADLTTAATNMPRKWKRYRGSVADAWCSCSLFGLWSATTQCSSVCSMLRGARCGIRPLYAPWPGSSRTA